MLGMRYHMVSLVAVFLSLAVGVIVGTVMADAGQVEKRRDAVFETLLKSIKNDIEDATRKNRALEADLSRHEDFMQIVFPTLIKDRLAQAPPMAVIMNAEVNTKTRELTSDTLDKAGGTGTHITLAKSFPQDDEALQQLTEAFPELKEVDVLEDAVWRRLAADLGATDHLFLDELIRRGYVQVTGAENLPAQRSVLFLTEEPKISEGFLTMAEMWSEMKFPVVVLEVTEVEKSAISKYGALSVSSVDNVDTSFGQLALVLVLTGKEGNFGIKSGAQALIPEL